MAQRALIESPEHDNNILADDVTRVGIGIAHCPDPLSRKLYITEIFAIPREEYQPESVQETLISRIDDLRQNGAGSMIPNPELEEDGIPFASVDQHAIQERGASGCAERLDKGPGE